MSQPIVSVDSSEIHEGKLEELRRRMTELVEFVEDHEDRPVAYSVYLGDEDTTMTVVQVHPDSTSMERHLKLAAERFAKVSDLLTLRRVDIYGEPSAELVEQMRRKAELLGTASVAVHRHHAGFLRGGAA